MSLLDEIDAFLERNEMSPTAFGLKALNDPPFVQQLRTGRDIKMSTAEKVRNFMREWRPDSVSVPSGTDIRGAM